MINPARDNRDVVVAAVGARDLACAEEFAVKHGIPKAYGSYEALIDDPDLDAIYVLVPTSMRGKWTRVALAAGKHVLVEKPFTANAAEAQELPTWPLSRTVW
jgi:predicted dehydrogenase